MLRDHIPRGVHAYHRVGQPLFALLRFLDPIVISLVLSHFGALGHPRQQLLLALITIGAARHGYWGLFLHPHPIEPGVFFALVALYNLGMDLTWTLVALYVGGSAPIGLRQYLAVAMFAVGSFVETYSEVQRRAFKANPANRGKLHTTGLFGVAQHINYTGYALWRAALGLYTGSWLAFALSWHNLLDFAVRSVPLLQAYLRDKYRDEKARYDRLTPYKLLPGLW